MADLRYHIRRTDREITDQKALKQLINYANHMALAMANENEPYVVPLDYIYVEKENAVYFHCTKEGKKIEFLKKNPKVWGLVVLDQGFGDGQCVNLYASVMFSGKVEFVEEQKAKHDVLIEFAKKTNKKPEPTIQRLEKMAGTDNEALFNRAALGRIKIETLTGKRSTEMTIERLFEITKK